MDECPDPDLLSKFEGAWRKAKANGHFYVSEFLHAGPENEVHHSIEDGRKWARVPFYMFSGDIEMKISISISSMIA